MMKRLAHVLLGMVMLGAWSAHAQSPREQLNQLVGQLQANPTDSALRERIIKLAQTIKPAPPVPEEARRHFVEGTAIARAAQTASQQGLAVQSFQEALKIAPWWGDAYYNLAVAQELTGQFDAAQDALKFYLLTNPGDKEVREAQDRIYALGAKKRLAVAAQSSPEVAAERERKLLASLDGVVWVSDLISDQMDPRYNNGRSLRYGRTGYAVRNRQLQRLSGVGWWPGESEPAVVSGGVSESRPLTAREMTVSWDQVPDPSCNPMAVRISEDGKTLTITSRCYGRVVELRYSRQ